MTEAQPGQLSAHSGSRRCLGQRRSRTTPTIRFECKPAQSRGKDGPADFPSHLLMQIYRTIRHNDNKTYNSRCKHAGYGYHIHSSQSFSKAAEGRVLPQSLRSCLLRLLGVRDLSRRHVLQAGATVGVLSWCAVAEARLRPHLLSIHSDIGSTYILFWCVPYLIDPVSRFGALKSCDVMRLHYRSETERASGRTGVLCTKADSKFLTIDPLNR